MNTTRNFSYILAISFCSLILFLKSGTHTAFEWTTTQDIPFILRIIDPNFINNDFYTNSVAGSPRFIFSYIVYGFTLLGFDWYSALYFLKLLLVVCVPSLIFLTMQSVYTKWHPYSEKLKHYNIAEIILFLGAIGFFATLIDKSPFGLSFGWNSIQLFAVNNLNPMTLSFAVGLLYNISTFKASKFRYVSPVLLLISTLIHPVIGIYHFIFSMTFKLPISFEKRSFIELGLDFIIGIIGFIVFLYFFKEKSNTIDSVTFIDIYVYSRHPHHYLMSSLFGWSSIVWIFFLLFPVVLSLKANKGKYCILSCIVFILFISAPIIQFLGTEVWKVKEIAILGPSRFTAYVSIFWVLNTVIVGFSIHKNNASINLEKAVSLLRFVLYFLYKLQDKQKLYTFLFIVFFLNAFYFTHKHPLDYYNKAHVRETVEWILKNTKDDSVFFVHGLDSFFVRVYARRAVFADDAFPFNEGDVKEFSERYTIFKKSKKFTPSDYACLNKYYNIDFLILPKNQDFKEYAPLFSNDFWLVYNISSFNTNELLCSTP